jgi:hypothetical protein
LNSDLDLVRNEVLFLADGDDSWLLLHHYWGHILGQILGVIFSPYTWNLEGKLRNLKRPLFRGIRMPFLFLGNCED